MDAALIVSNPLWIAIAALAAAVIVEAVLLFDIRGRWRSVFGRPVKTGSGALEDVLQRLAAVEQRLDAADPRLAILERIGSIAVQRVGFLRFNPFSDIGGDQSFALALLDREGTGVIVSSLYTREGVRLYAKEVASGAPKHPLSDEEREVLQRALGHSAAAA